MTFTPRPGLHPIFETLAYTVGYAVYRRSRDRRGDFLPDDYRWLIIAAASIGALLGSRFLGLLEEIPISQLTWRNLLFPGGKTIVGGLLGGWLAVEIAKRFKHIHSRTGDLFVVPLCIGIAIGRIGCFLAGLADDTFGTSTHLPWGGWILATVFPVIPPNSMKCSSLPCLPLPFAVITATLIPKAQPSVFSSPPISRGDSQSTSSSLNPITTDST